ncbi:MAG: hypothetical protein DF168_00236 [Candidatus Moanabacter tarae]|uniref:Uncharacterized protein n=1 Tax=Candidatus Moanibacter tarae TaxID=2200854 RepID=A0A2Z4ANK8_9BACT|nr:MAG: hypothetical protein DF168_00236 [Candidatus Moanabacter tarae]
MVKTAGQRFRVNKASSLEEFCRTHGQTVAWEIVQQSIFKNIVEVDNG